MALLSLRDVGLGFGGAPLLEHASVQLQHGERVCLLGRNGAGKSTLLKLVAGHLAPDAGDLALEAGATVAYLPQDVPSGLEGSVFDVVAEGIGEPGAQYVAYQRVARQAAQEATEAVLARMARLQQALDLSGGWEIERKVETVLSRMALDPGQPVETLSGGLKRRVLLARALVNDPDLLLLDEPTNHLDIEAITWLETFLLGYNATLLFVTHDRQFLRNLATRILELDRGRLSDWSCDYDTFLERKAAVLEAEEKEWERFDKRLAQEEIWIRKGIKARRTRNEGRVRVLKQMRDERRSRREREGTVRMQVNEADRTGRRVIEAKNVSYSYGPGRDSVREEPVIRSCTTTIQRGDRVGVIGPNGSGKTTLLRLLLGDVPPDTGTVRHGTNLGVAYFDQLRAQLDGEKTARENMIDDTEVLTINGKPRHVISYLQDFLFSPDRAQTKVRLLSGGERNRLMLARLFARPSNLLVLDEPTNDLDIETLELLEELLLDYAGTILLVSHDRAFLNNVVTSTLVIEDGHVKEYAGGYDDWLLQRGPVEPPEAPDDKKDKKERQPRPKTERPKKLSFHQKRELEALPDRIEALETEQARLYEQLGDPALYKEDDGAAVVAVQERLGALKQELETAYQRWVELEALEAES